MKEAFKQLKQKSIIDSQKIEVIRRYIKSRFPDAPQKQQGAIFADAVHKLIDGNISQFDEKYRVYIKDSVFRKAARKPKFAINADEIFSSALLVNDQDNKFYDSLMGWLTNNQDTKVTKEELVVLSEKIKDLSPEELEVKLEEMIAIVDEQEQIERRIREISLSMGLGAVKKEELKDGATVLAGNATEKPKTPKTLFVKKEGPAEPGWDLDKEIEAVLESPKSAEEISVLGKKPVELPRESVESPDQEGFSRNDADSFFDSIQENAVQRKERLRPPGGGLSEMLQKLGDFIRSHTPAKKAKLQDVLVQIIILLVLVVGIGTYFAVVDSRKTLIKVPEELTNNKVIIDTYGEVFDMYLTKKSRDLKK